MMPLGSSAMQAVEAEARSRLRPSAFHDVSRRMSGAALPGVLVIAVLLLLATAVWFEITLTEMHRTANLSSRMIAFQAADAALETCAQLLLDGHPPVLPAQRGHEPQRWRQPGIFDDIAAVTPFSMWPNAVQPPRCVIEAWRLPQLPEARAYLLTARGVGATPDVTVWLQSQILLERSMMIWRWRRVAAGPGAIAEK